MRAVTIRDNQLSVEEHPDPQPGSGEVLIRVHAAGLNGADMMQLAGHYPAPPGSPQDIPGLELAGVITSSPDKAGRDAATFAGLAAATGVTATTDVGAIIVATSP